MKIPVWLRETTHYFNNILENWVLSTEHVASRSRHLDVSWKALCSQTGPEKMWQDLQFDSCAHWLVLQLLLYTATLMHKRTSTM